ncbi:MAG: acyl-CoA dehydrogenase family protein [Gammaproteobacteria bacterium]|nr:acyl-CoA dehydrogenase family protein [Gammaproteobacteria bacterium]MDE0512288.1 acyl-CoA dehydrogenase family protein [Gammaproteobacteria bacterium]
MNTALNDQRELASTLVDRAKAVASGLRERAPEAEERRRVHAESFRAMKQADLFRAYTPARFGGYELHPRYFWRIAAEIAKGCPSSSWVYSVMSCHTFVTALFPEQAQEEVFGADPNAGISGILPDRTSATRTDGGYVLKNSVWPFGSGCHNANWFLLGAQLDGMPPGHDKAFFLVPPEDIEIKDDWYVTGLRATGSNSVSLKQDEYFVPGHRMLKAETALAHKYGTARPLLYRAPFAPLLVISLSAGTTMGAATGALEFYEDLLRTRSARPMVYTDDILKIQLSSTHHILAEATAKLEAARLMTDHAMDLCYEAAADYTRILSTEQRARIRLYGVHAMHQAREVVNILFQDSGGSSLHERSLMQRYYRDINAMSMHEAMHDEIIKEVYGRLRLNQTTTHWLL